MSMKIDFKTALSVVYRTRHFDEELSDPFLIYSRMSDLIGNDYENEKKLKLFFAVEKRVNLFAEIIGGCKEEELKGKYVYITDLMSEKSFSLLVNLIIKCVCYCNCFNMPCTYGEDELSEYYDDAEIEYDDCENFLQSDDSEDIGCKYTPKRKRTGLKAFVGCSLFVCVAVLVLCGVLKTQWSAYRWIVGVTSAIIIVVGSFTLSEVIYEEVFNCVLLGVLVVVNLVMRCVFRSNYSIICYWVVPAITIYGVYATGNAFVGYEAVCGWIDVCCCILSVGTLLINIFL